MDIDQINSLKSFNNINEDIKKYCEMNNISDIDAFTLKCLIQGFNIIKYGLSPVDNIKKQNKISIKDGKINDIKREEKIEQEKQTISNDSSIKEKEIVKPIEETKTNVIKRKIKIVKRQ